jgi:hypothetical protein
VKPTLHNPRGATIVQKTGLQEDIPLRIEQEERSACLSLVLLAVLKPTLHCQLGATFDQKASFQQDVSAARQSKRKQSRKKVEFHKQIKENWRCDGAQSVSPRLQDNEQEKNP